MTTTDIEASDLTPAVRDWVQSRLQRPLAENDRVSLTLLPTSPRNAADRDAAWARFHARLASFRRGGDTVADGEIDAAVDEAMASVRPGYEPVR